ncbi:MAG: S8 family serine peptidase [Eubacterium sp.]
MKKKIYAALSLILAVLLIIPCNLLINKNAFGNKGYTVSIDEFCEKVKSFSEDYTYLEAVDKFDRDNKPVFSAYENRLIVKTGRQLKNVSAVDSVYYDDIAVLQYEDRNAMNEDFNTLKAKGYTVSKDNILYMSSAEYDSGVNNNYAYNDSGANYTKDIFANNGTAYSDIVVGVMDTGIDYTHSIYNGTGRYIQNPVNFSASGGENDPMDDNGHGTLVSGIIAMSTPDNVKVKPYKVLDANGSCETSALIACCEYILAESKKPDVVNMSLGGYDLLNIEDGILDSAVSKLVDAGITVCCAAGNEGVSCDYATPASCEKVITVSSHGTSYGFSDFSDYGNCVDVCAPGENVYAPQKGGGYSSGYSGTSFSTPFVSAACTYVLMQHPKYTPSQVKEKIRSSAVPVARDNKLYYGCGILSFANLIDGKALSPISPSVKPGLYHNSQTISFNVPSGYDLVYRKSFTIGNVIPEATSTNVYTAPITVDADTIITYALVKDGKYVSNITSAEYEIQYYADESDFTMSGTAISGYTGTKKNFIVPDTINGVAPTEVLSEVFKESTTTAVLTGVVLPDSVTRLGAGCFKNCSRLRHITAKGVTSFAGTGVFQGCSQLRDEVMPNLKTVTASAFDGCTKLHYIDFGENVTSLKSNLFSNSGLMEADMPNAKISLLSNEEVFKGSKLFKCNLPLVSELGVSMFYGCSYLYDYTFGEIKTIRSSALYGCSNLLYLDVSNLTSLYSGALEGCYIDDFYAPGITKFKDSNGVFGKYCNVRTLDLPNFTAKLNAKSLNYSSVRNIYLDSVTEISSTAFVNMPFVSIFYLPNAQAFYSPTVSKTTVDTMINNPYCDYSTTDIVWIPSATAVGELKFDNLGFLLAPNISQIDVKLRNGRNNIAVLGENATATFTAFGSGVGISATPVVVTSQGTDAVDGCTTVSYSECEFYAVAVMSSGRGAMYECAGIRVVVPGRLLLKAWGEGEINKTPDTAKSRFIFDINQDSIINAKDFAMFKQYIWI